MIPITLDQLRQIMPLARSRASRFLGPLNSTMARYEINTTVRQAAFLAQIAHESGSLRYTEELASGEAYEGRVDLGNTQPGDGVRFKGRGLLQITGRANYGDCSASLFGLRQVLIFHPRLLTSPHYAAASAGWFWDARELNKLADATSFSTITRRINGGLNGYAERLAFYLRALEVLEPSE
jgi:putative chitinase